MSKTKKKFTAIIVDDEKPARDLLAKLLTGDSEIEIVAQCSDGVEAIASLAEHQVDVMFLDIHMPRRGGFEVLEALGEKQSPEVVFVTAYDQYAVKAFEFSALDYLLKPFRRERFTQTIERVKERLANRGRRRSPNWRSMIEYWKPTQPTDEEIDGTRKGSFLQRLFVRSGKRSFSLDVNDIDWIKSLDHFVEVHSKGKSYLLYSSIGALEQKLDAQQFMRVHRTVIISTRAIESFRTDSSTGSRYVVLTDGSEHRISRSRQSVIAGLS